MRHDTIAKHVSNQTKADPHLSTFGFFPTQKKPKPEKPKKLKFLPTLKKRTDYELSRLLEKNRLFTLFSLTCAKMGQFRQFPLLKSLILRIEPIQPGGFREGILGYDA